jgi:putative oxidoreductase
MKKENLFLQSFINQDKAIFFLRIIIGLLIFINHGFEKLFHFDHILEIFPDPIGIGKLPSLLFALLTDGILSIFLIFGLFTRISTFLIAINLIVAFFAVHNANLTEIRGELALAFLISIITIFLIGPGKKSLDFILFRSQT